MKIKEFDKLEKKLNGQNFHESYGNINRVMTGLSYFGHVASIFLAFFMLSKILLGVMDNQAVVYVVTVIILAAVEMLKRDIFHKFSVLYLKLRGFTKDVMPLFLLSVAIIGISFYSSIKGAGEYSSKGEKIDSDTEAMKKQYSDSVTKVFQPRIDAIEKMKVSKEQSLGVLYRQQEKLNELYLAGTLTKDQKKLQKALGSQIKELEEQNRPFILQKNKEKAAVESERDEIIKRHEGEANKQSKKKKQDNSTNSIAFVIFSTLIEISILAGVYFNDYYDVRSYREKRAQLEKDPSFQKWRLYSQILEVVYTEETKLNQKLPSNKGIIDMCKMNDIIVLPKDVVEFLKSMASLGVVRVSGSTRYVSKSRAQSFELLDKHFNIE